MVSRPGVRRSLLLALWVALPGLACDGYACVPGDPHPPTYFDDASSLKDRFAAEIDGPLEIHRLMIERGKAELVRTVEPRKLESLTLRNGEILRRNDVEGRFRHTFDLAALDLGLVPKIITEAESVVGEGSPALRMTIEPNTRGEVVWSVLVRGQEGRETISFGADGELLGAP
ncbi:MAG: hypothetical protein R3A51_14920 [Nannocystaceae bacterium]|nr:hypothetical protein [Myxococcales bacterium]